MHELSQKAAERSCVVYGEGCWSTSFSPPCPTPPPHPHFPEMFDVVESRHFAICESKDDVGHEICEESVLEHDFHGCLDSDIQWLSPHEDIVCWNQDSVTPRWGLCCDMTTVPKFRDTARTIIQDIDVEESPSVELTIPLEKDTARTYPITVISPLGQEVNVYPDCSSGTCTCTYYIGGVKSQLKPCRFASFILTNDAEFHDKYIDLLWYVTDGCPIVDSAVDSYECNNYLSITCPENVVKMNAIVSRELNEGMISRVTDKPTCIHALGAVPKGNGGIRQITDCSRPVGRSVNYHCGDLLKEFSFKNVENVVSLLNQGDFMTVIDIKAAYRNVWNVGCCGGHFFGRYNL